MAAVKKEDFARWRGTNEFTTSEFIYFVEHDLKVPSWVKKITLHHTFSPTEQTWKGLKHLDSLERFYRVEKGWHSGPHAFVTPKHWYILTPFDRYGVHAVSFNKSAWGIEVVHDGDKSPFEGELADNLYAGLAALFRKARLNPQKDLLFHRDDPLTGKSCPGVKVSKFSVMAGIMNSMNAHRAAKENIPHDPLPPMRHFEDGEDIPLFFEGRRLALHGERIDGTTYALLRETVSLLGGEVTAKVDSKKKLTILVTLPSKVIDLTGKVDMEKGRAWVKVRMLCELAGYLCLWDGKNTQIWKEKKP